MTAATQNFIKEFEHLSVEEQKEVSTFLAVKFPRFSEEEILEGEMTVSAARLFSSLDDEENCE